MTRSSRVMRRLGLTTIAVAISLSLAACAGEAPATDSTDGGKAESPLTGVNIILADHAPATHPIVVGGVEPFIAAVEEAGGTVEYFGNAELVGAQEMLPSVQSNVANIGAVILTYFPNDFREAGVAELPGSFPSATVGTPMLIKFMEEEMQEAFDKAGTVPIFTTAFPTYEIASNKKLETPDDLAGLTLRAAGGAVSQSVIALGAAPVSIPITEQYVALQRGTVDGAVGAFNQMTPYKTEEVVDYMTSNLAVGTSTVSWMANKEWFESLTKDQQAALQEIGTEISAKVAAHLDADDAASEEIMAEAGVEVYEIKDLKPFQTRLDTVWDDWAASVTEAGYDGEKLLAAWQKIIAE